MGWYQYLSKTIIKIAGLIKFGVFERGSRKLWLREFLFSDSFAGFECILFIGRLI